MSHSYNKRKKAKHKFNHKMAYNFGEFCAMRDITNWAMLPKEEYDQLWSYWISYKNFYNISEKN